MKMLYTGLMGAVLLMLAAAPVQACSTCKCGDPTITLLGAEKAFSGRFRAGVDLLWRSETQGADSNPLQIETEEQRAVLGLAYSASERLSFALQMPYVEKTISRRNFARQQGRGWGDGELSARYRLYKSGPLSGRHLAGIQAGIRAPTGETVRSSDGRVLDIDVQPDAGAWAGKLGGWYAYHRFPWFVSVSTKVYVFGDGDQGFDPGQASVTSLSAQFALNPRVALQAGLDARYSGENHYDNIIDTNSGGSLVMTRVGLSARLGQELVSQLAVQIPTLDRLKGAQEEDQALQFSLAYDF